MALYEEAVKFVITNISVFYSLILCYLFYLTLKLVTKYHTSHDNKYLIFSTFALIFAFDIWSRIYETNIKAFFEEFRSLLVLIPLAIFLIFTILENKRKKINEEKQKLRGAFQQYVSPDLIEEITKNPDKLKLGGEKKQLTVYFSDIRGFTTLSEKLSPEELVSFLNDYLSQMTDIVLDNKGVIDKYIGDAIMAFWGAPIEDKDHAIHACTSAIHMKKQMEKISEEFKKSNRPEIKIGMGINTGDMVVGNMGSSKRFDYTVIGDNVNLASRLESLTKQYHVGILISESTNNAILNKGFITRELDLVTVKGKTKPIKLYELICFEKELSDYQKKLNEKFSIAMKKYYSKEFKESKQLFTECKEKYNDETSEIYIQRCEEFIKNPPGEKWDGVFVATSK